MTEPNQLTIQPTVEQSVDPAIQRGRVARIVGAVVGRIKHEGAEVAPHDPVIDIAQDIDKYIHWAGTPFTKTDSELKSAIELLENDPQLDEKLGFEPTSFSPSPKQEHFVKENDPDLSRQTGSEFHVVQDEIGDDWLLKAPKGLNDVIQMTHNKQTDEHEVIAYQIARYLGYPVPETKLVIPQGEGLGVAVGEARLAYRFIPHALSYHLYEHARDPLYAQKRVESLPMPEDIKTARRAISNQADLDFRNVFNWVIGSFGDGSHQGIVDQQSGMHYAQDLGMSTFVPYKVSGKGQFDTHEQAMRASLSEDTELGYGYGLKPFITDENREQVAEYFEKLRGLDESTASRIIDPKTPMGLRDREKTSKAIVERAKALVKLFDEGLFDTHKTDTSS